MQLIKPDFRLLFSPLHTLAPKRVGSPQLPFLAPENKGNTSLSVFVDDHANPQDACRIRQ
jgi:hypothetical protein